MIDLKRQENENEEQFIFRIGQAKDSGQLDMSWDEIADVINKEFRSDESEYRTEAAYRKPYQYVKGFLAAKAIKQYESESEYSKELENKKQEIRKERMKLQTANLERNRLDRNEARQEMYYEYVGNVCDILPLPDFKPLIATRNSSCGVEYLVTIADVHYGATFKSMNNE